MPDPEKLQTLARVGFRLLRTCDSCTHGRFQPGHDYGRCGVHTYTHGKHTGTQQMPAHRIGTCPDHALRPGSEARLGALAGFLEAATDPG